MHVWSDDGVVLSTIARADGRRVVDIFTRKHGRCLGLTRTLSDVCFTTLSLVGIQHISRDEASIGTWKRRWEDKSWVHVINSTVHISVCQMICLLLKRMMPLAVSNEGLYGLVVRIIRGLGNFSDSEIVAAYAYFEFLLLVSGGFGIDPRTCNAGMVMDLWASGLPCHASTEDIETSLKVTSHEISRHIPRHNNTVVYRSLSATTSWDHSSSQLPAYIV